MKFQGGLDPLPRKFLRPVARLFFLFVATLFFAARMFFGPPRDFTDEEVEFLAKR